MTRVYDGGQGEDKRATGQTRSLFLCWWYDGALGSTGGLLLVRH